MNTQLNSTNRILFYSLWFIGLLLQAYFTEITADEAYYWMYSKQLAWGYFDHPPVIAFIIKLGYGLFPNEFGVRLVPVVLNCLTLFLFELIIKPREVKTFFMLVASVGILHFMGFFALPDSPFLFLSTAYLFVYKTYTSAPSAKKALLLGSIFALMCMSKYHAILILGLTILSNPRLLTSRHFWFSAAIATTLLIPHILWQVKTGFPSLSYHLFERSTESYKIGYTIEYLLSQLFVLGPLTGVLFFIAVIQEKAKNQFEKTLKFLFWGGYIFFLFMTFKGRVEGHWTLFTILPALYFGYQYLIELNNSTRVVNYIFSISIFLIATARLVIVIDVETSDFPMISKLTKSFRNRSNMLAINQLAGNHPVAFMNSYQRASLYSFYSKSEGFSLNNIMGRKNQFDIWHTENTHRGEKILMIPNYNITHFDSVPGIQKTTRYKFIENFQSFSAIAITVTGLQKKVNASDTLNITLNFTKPRGSDIDLCANPNYPSYVYYQFFEGKTLVKKVKVIEITNEMLDHELEIGVIAPVERGNYGLYFTIKTGWLPETINSKRYDVRV